MKTFLFLEESFHATLEQFFMFLDHMEKVYDLLQTMAKSVEFAKDRMLTACPRSLLLGLLLMLLHALLIGIQITFHVTVSVPAKNKSPVNFSGSLWLQFPRDNLYASCKLRQSSSSGCISDDGCDHTVSRS